MRKIFRYPEKHVVVVRAYNELIERRQFKSSRVIRKVITKILFISRASYYEMLLHRPPETYDNELAEQLYTAVIDRANHVLRRSDLR